MFDLLGFCINIMQSIILSGILIVSINGFSVDMYAVYWHVFISPTLSMWLCGFDLVFNEVPNQAFWMTVKAGKPNGRLFFERSCHVSPAYIIITETLLSLSLSHIHNSKVTRHLHTRNLWLSLGNSLFSFESSHTWVSAHSSDRLMNLNRRGFRCLDSIRKKKSPDVFSWHRRSTCLLSKSSAWHICEIQSLCVPP